MIHVYTSTGAYTKARGKNRSALRILKTCGSERYTQLRLQRLPGDRRFLIVISEYRYKRS